MSKAPEARSSRIIQDGSLLGLAGLEAGTFADKQVFVIQSGLLDLVTAVVSQGGWIAPAAGTLLAVRIVVDVQLGTGPGVVMLGKQGDPDYFVSHSVAIASVAGTELTATLLQTAIAKNDRLFWSGDGGATTTGSVFAYATIALN